MGWEKWQQDGKVVLNSASIIEPFHILTATLLTLLLPLSFLLLSRLSLANYLLSLTLSPQTQPYSIPIFLLFHTIPTILYSLVSLLSIFTLIHCLTGQLTLISRSPDPIFRPPMYIAWIMLCIFQVCVGLGIEGSVAIGIDGSGFSRERSCLSKVVFFFGIHETMMYWSRTVVKPVVDDTILGFRKEERWVNRAAVAAGFGGLWWWRLRGEVESLVVMVEVKKELLMGVGVGDFIGWWLYYLTVIIGMVKIAKIIMWLAVILLFRRIEEEEENPSHSFTENEDHKV